MGMGREVRKAKQSNPGTNYLQDDLISCISLAMLVKIY